MKKIFLISIILCTFLFNSCEDFLHVEPRNKRIIKTTQDYKSIMNSFMYTYKYYMVYYPILGTTVFGEQLTDLMSYTQQSCYVNVRDYKTGDVTEFAKKMLSWTNTDTQQFWTNLYGNIGPLNMIIGEIDNSEQYSEYVANITKGEAYYWRAYNFFKLLQYFAPYDDGSIGIPVFTGTHIDPVNGDKSRKPQSAAFKLIISDLKNAIELLEVTEPKETFNLGYDNYNVKALLSAVYLWKGGSQAAEETDYENCIKYASEAVKNRTLSSDSQHLRDLFDCQVRHNSIESQEFGWRFAPFYDRQLFGGDVAGYGGNYRSNGTFDPLVSEDFYNSYEEGDVRKTTWYAEYLGKHYHNKYNHGTVWNGHFMVMPYRTAETILNKAEAEARTNKLSDAQATLDKFYTQRGVISPTIASDQQALIKQVLDERHKEFIIEYDIYWLDCKRTFRSFTRNEGGIDWNVDGHSWKYCFPIPLTEIKNNPSINENNKGWDQFIY